MKSLLDLLQYPRLDAFNLNESKEINRKRDNFVFIYHKTEKMTEEEKLKKLQEMGDRLGVATGHKIPIEMLIPGMEDTGVEMNTFVKAGLTTGINTSGELDDETKKSAKQLKAVLVPHTRKVLMSPQRLNISKFQCPIQ